MHHNFESCKRIDIAAIEVPDGFDGDGVAERPGCATTTRSVSGIRTSQARERGGGMTVLKNAQAFFAGDVPPNRVA